MKIADTDFLVGVLRGHRKASDLFRGWLEEIATTTLNAAELHEGAAASERREEATMAVERLLASLPLIPFGPRHARAYGPLARGRKKLGLPGGPMDLLIASIAVVEGATIVTRNVADFEGHQGLRVESW